MVQEINVREGVTMKDFTAAWGGEEKNRTRNTDGRKITNSLGSEEDAARCGPRKGGRDREE